MRFQASIALAAALCAAVPAQAQTADKAAPKAKTGGGSAIVAIAPCIPIESLLGQFPKELKQNVELIVDGKTVGTVQSCSMKTIPVRPGQHSFRAANFPKFLPIPDPVFNVPAGQKLYIVIKVGQTIDYWQVSADDAKRTIAALPKQ